MKILKLAPLALVLAMIGAASFGATSHVGAALIGVAHAAPDPVSAAPASDSNPLGYVMLGLAALVAVVGGALRILDVLIPGLKWLAPRTETTIDDAALEYAQKAHDRLDEVETVLAKLVRPLATETPKSAQGGFVARVVMLYVAFVGAGVLASYMLCGCASFKSEVKTIENGVVTCAKGDVAAAKALGLQLGTEALVQLVSTGKIDWTALKNQTESAGKSQGITVAACAFGGLVADLQAVFQAANPTAPQALLAMPGPLDGSAEALTSFQAAHGITSIVQ